MSIWLPFIAKRYRIKHKILYHLLSKQERNPKHDITQAKMPYKGLARAIKENPELVYNYNEDLIDRKHITCRYFMNEHLISLSLDGRTAALEEVHLREGIKARIDDIDIAMRWFVPILALLISAWAAIENYDAKSEMKVQQEEINILKQEIQRLKDK